MSKRVQITEQLQATIRRAIGDPDFDTNLVAVYEARFLTTEAVSKKGTLWDGSRISASTLAEMAEYMGKENNAVPLQIMHETELLPIGKVFAAKTLPMENGETELRGMFYVDAQDTVNIRKIETSIVDEVSVGLATTHLYCSECNFDYLGPDADLMNVLTCTCGEGHMVGEAGVHVRGVGMSKWYELSLVGAGAAKKAKILGQSKQRLSKETVDRLAANKNWEAGLLQLSTKMNFEKETTKMSAEYEALMAKYEAVVGENAQLKADGKAKDDKIVSLEAAATEVQAKLTAKEAEITELKAQSGVSEEVQKAADDANAALKEATDLLLPHAKAALVASGVAEAEVPADLKGLMASIEKQGLKLHQVFGAGSMTDPKKVGASAEEAADAARKTSFKL